MIVWHVTSRKKFLRYLQQGMILPPMRARKDRGVKKRDKKEWEDRRWEDFGRFLLFQFIATIGFVIFLIVFLYYIFRVL